MEPISSERLTTRSFMPEDGEDLYDYLSREEVVHFEPYRVFTRELAMAEAKRRAGQECFLAVCLKNEDGLREKVIGNLYFERQESSDTAVWELGYVFHSLYQGKGYATEACRSLLAHAFTSMDADRVTANCNPDNRPSWRLLERLGFRREGHLIQNVYFWCDDSGAPLWQDTYEYGLMKEDFYK